VVFINHGRVVRRESRSLFFFFSDRFLVLDSFLMHQDLPFEGSTLMMHVGNSDFFFPFFTGIVSFFFLYHFCQIEGSFLMMQVGTSGFGFDICD
jgi:hypothetical protein